MSGTRVRGGVRLARPGWALVPITLVVVVLLLVGASIVVDLRWALMIVAVVSLAVWIMVSRPHPALILLALPMSLVPPPLLIVMFGSKQLAVTVSDAVIALALFAWAGRPVRVSRVWLLGNALLVGWTFLSLFVTQDFGRSVIGLKVVIEAALVAVIAATATTTTPRKLFRRLAWSTALMSIALTAQIASQGALNLLAAGGADTSLAADVATAHNSTTELTISVGTSNYTGAVILLGLIPIFCYWPFIEARWERLVAVVALAIGAVGVLATASKSQVLSLAVIVLVAAVLAVVSRVEGRKRAGPLSIVILGALVFAGVAASWSYVGAIFAPLLSTGVSAYGTAGRRIEIWGSALTTIYDHPFFGVGVFDLQLQSETVVFPTAHNTFLQVAAETGIPGLLIYLRLLWEPIRCSHKQVRTVAILLVGGLVVAGMAEPTLRTGAYDYVAWLLLGSVVALGQPAAGHQRPALAMTGHTGQGSPGRASQQVGSDTTTDMALD